MAKNLTIKNPGARGAAGGLGARLGARFLGAKLGPGAGTIGTGMYLKDDWLQEMGGYQLGLALGENLPFVGDSAMGENSPGAGRWL